MKRITEVDTVQQEILRRNEVRLVEAAEMANLGYWEFDFQTQVFTVTDQMWAMFRTTAEEQGGYQIPAAQFAQKFVHPDDAHIVGAEIRKGAESPEPEPGGQAEYRIIRADGSEGVNIVRYRVIKDEQGRPVKAVGIGQDITERKRMEDALMAREQEFRSLAESSPDSIIRYDAEHRVRYLNSNLLHELRIGNVDDVIGKRPIEVWPDGRFAVIDEAAEQAMKSGSMVKTELVRQTETGEIAFGDIYVVPERDVDGEIIGTIAFGRDITERKQAELALQESQKRLRAAASIARLGYWDYNGETDLFTFDDHLYAMLHTTAEEQGGYQMSPAEYIDRFLHPDDIPLILEAFNKAVSSTGREYNAPLEYRVRYADGGIGHVLVRIRVLRDDEGRIILHAGTSQDITERKQAEETLRENEARLAEAADIAQLGHWEFEFQTQVFTVTDQLWAIFRTTAEAEGGYQMPAEEYTRKFVHPDDAYVLSAEIQKAIESTDPDFHSQVEQRIIRADGSVGVNLVRYRVIKDEQGRPVKSIGIGQDITERKQAEEALRHNRKRLAEALETAKLAYWEVDVTNHTFTLDDQFYTLFGTTAEEQGGYQIPAVRFAQEFVHPDDVHIMGIEARKAEETTDPGYTSQFEHRFLGADGQVGYVSVRSRIVKDTEGRTVKTVGISQDITERKQAELAIQESQARLAQAASMAKLGYWDYNGETDLFTFDDHFYAMLHTTVEEQSGYQMSPAEYIDRFLHPDDVPLILEAFNKAVSSTGREYNAPLEYRVRYADGGIGHVLVRIRVLRDDEGHIILHSGTTQDITERKQAEKILAKTAVELETVSHVGTVASTILDTQQLLQRVVDLTRSRFGLYHAHIYLLNEAGDTLQVAAGTGEAGAEMVAQEWNIPLTQEQSPVVRVARTQEGIIVDDVRQAPDFLPNPLLPDARSELAVPMIAGSKLLGVLHVQHTQAGHFTEQDKQIQMTLASQIAAALSNARLFEETTRAKEEAEQATAEAEVAKAKAESANQAKSEFLSSMSHELRTPLNGILGYAQILKRDRNLTTLQEDGLDIIQQSGEHLLTLISDILDLAKIEAGKLEFQPTSIHLPTFLEGVAGMIHMRTQQKGLGFIYEAMTSIPAGIEADEKRLRQILINLLGNAVKFTDEGQVSLRVSVVNGQSHAASIQNRMRFEVADTGIGLEPEQLEKIFQPFEQVGNKARQAEGTGLGLPISRQLVQAMGGELQVESQPGQGSTFWFEIPLRVVEVDTEEKQQQARTIIGYKGRRQKALVVDDRGYNRSVLVNFLEPLGFEIVSAEDGRQAIAQAQAERPDIIFMDMIMPVMMGFEAVQQIRQIPEIKSAIIIGASASVFEKDRQQVKLAGCDDFLAKPVNFGTLLELLDTHLQLEWLYDDEQEGDRCEGDREAGRGQAESENLIPPPEEELEALFEMAMRGNMTSIRERAVELEQADQRYKLFTDELQRLAKAYDDDGVLALIEECRKAAQNE